MTVRTSGALAVAAAAATAVVGMLVFGLTVRLDPLARDTTSAVSSTLFIVGMTVLSATGALVVRTGHHLAMGWLLVATGLANSVGRLGFGLAVAAHQAGREALAAHLGWFTNWGWIPGAGLAMLLFLRFPDGHVHGSWRGVLERLILTWTVAAALITAAVPGPLGAEQLAPLTNPLGLSALGDFLDEALTVVFAVNPGILLLVAASTVLRWRRAQERQQLRTVALALAFLAVATAVAVATGQASVAESLAWLVLPASVAWAVARHDLWDVDLRRRFDRLRRVREEERTRLQHDLHDSLGPLLGSINMRLEAARNLLYADASRAEVDKVLCSIGAQAEAAVVEVRRVIEELGPSALADRDLVAALADLVESHSDSGTRFTLEAAGDLPPLLPAVEVALYRVAGEAVRNVVRHAQAGRCTLSLVSHGTSVELVVTDDGVGLMGRTPGVGRRAMADRIASVGGSFTMAESAAGGVRVAASVAGVDVS